MSRIIFDTPSDRSINSLDLTEDEYGMGELDVWIILDDQDEQPSWLASQQHRLEALGPVLRSLFHACARILAISSAILGCLGAGLLFYCALSSQFIVYPLAGVVKYVFSTAVIAYCLSLTLLLLYTHTWVSEIIAERAARRQGRIAAGRGWYAGLVGEALRINRDWYATGREVLLGLDDYFEGRIVVE
jgi:hypothetical protein